MEVLVSTVNSHRESWFHFQLVCSPAAWLCDAVCPHERSHGCLTMWRPVGPQSVGGFFDRPRLMGQLGMHSVQWIETRTAFCLLGSPCSECLISVSIKSVQIWETWKKCPQFLHLGASYIFWKTVNAYNQPVLIPSASNTNALSHPSASHTDTQCTLHNLHEVHKAFN